MDKLWHKNAFPGIIPIPHVASNRYSQIIDMKRLAHAWQVFPSGISAAAKDAFQSMASCSSAHDHTL